MSSGSTKRNSRLLEIRTNGANCGSVQRTSLNGEPSFFDEEGGNWLQQWTRGMKHPTFLSPPFSFFELTFKFWGWISSGLITLPDREVSSLRTVVNNEDFHLCNIFLNKIREVRSINQNIRYLHVNWRDYILSRNILVYQNGVADELSPLECYVV